MPRLRQVSRAEADERVLPMYDRIFGDRDPVAEPGTDTGTPGNWWTTMALVPDLYLSCVNQFGLFNSLRRALPAALRELAITRTGFAGGSQFVFSQHSKASRAVGLSEEKIAALPAWGVAEVFTAHERAVLAYVDELVLAEGRVQDATFQALQAFLTDEAILELTFVSCTYRLHASICRALRLEFDDLPERLVEIAAPSGAKSADVLSQISQRTPDA